MKNGAYGSKREADSMPTTDAAKNSERAVVPVTSTALAIGAVAAVVECEAPPASDPPHFFF